MKVSQAWVSQVEKEIALRKELKPTTVSLREEAQDIKV